MKSQTPSPQVINVCQLRKINCNNCAIILNLMIQEPMRFGIDAEQNFEMSDEQKPKEHSDVLREQLLEGLKESDQSNTRLLLSAFIAGLEIGFTILIMGVLYTVLNPHYDKNVLHLIVSLGY